MFIARGFVSRAINIALERCAPWVLIRYKHFTPDRLCSNKENS